MKIEFEIDREVLKKIILSHKKFVECSSTANLLSCLHFELIQNTLKVYTTDGNRCLESIIEVNNISNENGNFNVDMALIKNLVITPGIAPILVTVDDPSISFNDEANGTIQKFNLTFGVYPNVETLITSSDYKENTHTIKLNHKFFKQFDALLFNTRTMLIELNLNKADSTKPIVARSKSDGLEQIALLLPVQVRS